MRYNPAEIPICTECGELGNPTKTCHRCNIRYCVHYASLIDFHYCGNCMSDVTMEVSKNSRGKEIHLRGADKFFAEYTVHNTPDDFLDMIAEHHFNLFRLVLMEKETRREEARRQQAQVTLESIGIPSISPATQKSPSKKKSSNTSSNVIKSLRRQGLSQATIDNIIAAMKEKETSS